MQTLIALWFLLFVSILLIKAVFKVVELTWDYAIVILILGLLILILMG